MLDGSDEVKLFEQSADQQRCVSELSSSFAEKGDIKKTPLSHGQQIQTADYFDTLISESPRFVQRDASRKGDVLLFRRPIRNAARRRSNNDRPCLSWVRLLSLMMTGAGGEDQMNLPQGAPGSRNTVRRATFLRWATGTRGMLTTSPGSR